jgi:hypothetical protein
MSLSFFINPGKINYYGFQAALQIKLNLMQCDSTAFSTEYTAKVSLQYVTYVTMAFVKIEFT